jgi:transcriptional regulator with XRE-family HTH domain
VRDRAVHEGLRNFSSPRRELRGFDVNQKAFARELGVSQAQLSRYEKGKSEMGAEVLLRISRKFGKSMEWVLTGKDE